MNKEYPTTRKSPVRLNDEQKYAVYTYAIENGCVYQKGEDITIRVEPSLVAKEINQDKILEVIINGHHVTEALSRVINWQKRLKLLPVMPIETVQMDMLKIEMSKKDKELAALDDLQKRLAKYMDKLSKIQSILAV